ncbi:MAG: DUF2971 domain-containing protein, partial [Lachnospiraceae bacterium]
RDLLTLVNNQIYAPSVEDLNDPCECMLDTADRFAHLEGNAEPLCNEYYMGLEELEIASNKVVKEIKSKYGVISFCSTFENELMWSYYGNGHKGFCIEYDGDVIKESQSRGCFFLNVEYCPQLPRYSFRTCTFNQYNTIKLTLGVKTVSWAHEKEKRLVIEEKGLKDIPESSVVGIYFGLRMSESNKELIKNSLTGRHINIIK